MQVASLSSRGLPTCCICGDQEDGLVKERVVRGEFQLVLITPELLLDKKEWRKMLLNDVYSSHLRTLVIDEAHTVKKWYISISCIVITAFLCAGAKHSEELCLVLERSAV